MYRDTMKMLMHCSVRYLLHLASKARRGDVEARKDELAICFKTGYDLQELAAKATEFVEHLEKKPPSGVIEQFALMSRPSFTPTESESR